MNNTWIKLTDVRCNKLMEALESMPMSKRDNTWNQLKLEIKQVQDMWKHIDIRALHRSQVSERAKSNRGQLSRVRE